ncbi:hypothetical protein [Mycolicibacterium litorale]|uniref:Uncharacterized protein n=1 Tax=Mycolicibacterium litorale TaxID=758802 RepID=A0AAD1IMW3_9MYCO|nr:hypothetical protein [Mycolicibacterium litorale]MCV7417061.1 hypothetical protein [Mycolicibacterium litorale]TDY04848.1 hypothetical protein BCL50_3626 [Mycolicibacterium litorale]BBY18275.1 hypothetical protein MLIT_38670 [Mycolicibacterium litorale]
MTRELTADGSTGRSDRHRAGRAGVLALRAPASSFRPDLDDDDGVDLSWFIVDIGGAEDPVALDIEDIEDLLALWPIVYQPCWRHGDPVHCRAPG